MSDTAKPQLDAKRTVAKGPDARAQVLAEDAREFVFGVVGHAGSGTSNVAQAFAELLRKQSPSFDAQILKARQVIEEWAKSEGLETPRTDGAKTIESATAWQNLGDQMRETTRDHAAVAKSLVRKIWQTRAQATGVQTVEGEPVLPDGKPRAYILDALRHPAEANLLRHIYQDAFVLIGVVCDPDVREQRLESKLDQPAPRELSAFMLRDEKDNKQHGQQVAKVFQLADFYVDNTPDRFLYTENGTKQRENPEWDINDKLRRLVRIVAHDNIERPELSETAMHHAFSAKMRSACLSRQVGVEIVEGETDLVTVMNDLLMLTKLNFNSCVYADGQPVTLRFADAVGEIITSVPERFAMKAGPPMPFKHYI